MFELITLRQIEQFVKMILKIKFILQEKKLKETYYWLELLKEMNLNEDQKNKIKSILDETNQLTKIFNKITSTLRNK